MTRTAPQPMSLLVGPEPTPPWEVALVWDLSARAGAALGAPAADPPGALELAIAPTDDDRLATVRLSTLRRTGKRAEIRTLVGARTRWLREAGFDHVDVEGVVSCTFRADAPTGPIFARCPLLESLGIPAGSYSLRGAATRE